MSDPNYPRDPQDPNDPQNPRDPNTRGRGPADSGNPYTRWIIAGAAVVILILAVFMFTGTDTVDEPAPEAGLEQPETAPETGTAPTDPDAPAADPEVEPADPEAEPADPEAVPDDGEETELEEDAN